jgi:hypothetical protein
LRNYPLGVGKHFDPDVVEAFFQCHTAFEKISADYLVSNQVTQPSLLPNSMGIPINTNLTNMQSAQS